MHVVIAGGHGKIGLRLAALLAGRGDTVTGVVRNPDHRAEVETAGATVAVLDMESASVDDLAAHLTGADAVVFAAGAGPDSGAQRKDTVDHLGAVKLIDTARELGVDHYVIVSSMGADPTHVGDEVFDKYLVAKGRADDAVRSSGLPFTIVRPTRLTDDDPTGTVMLGESADGGAVTRADVAAVIAALIERAGPGGRTLELTAGDTPIDDAVEAAL